MKVLSKVLIVFMVFAISTKSFAQKFGIKAGLNLSNMLFKDDDDNYNDNFEIKPGFHVGPTLELPIAKKFSFETAILVSTKGYRIKGKEDMGFGSVDYKGHLNLVYLELPLTPKVSFDVGNAKFYVALGPYISIGLSGKSKAEASYQGRTQTHKDEVKWGSEEDDELGLKRLDAGLTAGAGIEFGNLQFGLSYGYGLANIATESDNGFKIKNRVVGLSVGYKFGKD